MTTLSLALKIYYLFIGKLPGNLAHGWGHTNNRRLKHLGAISLALGADGEPFAVFIEGNLVERIQILLDIRSVEAVPGNLDAPVELLLKGQHQKTADRIAADGHIALLDDRPGLKKRIGVPMLDLPEFVLFQSRFIGTRFDVGLGCASAVKTGILFDFFLVDVKSALFIFEAASEAAVSEMRGSFFLGLLFDGSRDGLANGLVPEDQVRLCAIADGATWDRNRIERVFPKANQVLDYYHCWEHLHELALAQYGKGIYKAMEWVAASLVRLFLKHKDNVIASSKSIKPATAEAVKLVQETAGYLRKHSKRIGYGLIRRGDFDIGSATIESAKKLISHVRLNGLEQGGIRPTPTTSQTPLCQVQRHLRESDATAPAEGSKAEA